MKDEHVWEALGKARIVVRDGKVEEVGEPQLKYCPIFDKFRGIKELTCDAIRENMQFRIEDFGMCRADRKLRMRDYLSFGVSEMMHTAMDKGMIDAAVIVCEGCGTVVIDEPDMVQGIGGRVSGLVSTTPIPELIKRIGTEKVLDPATAKIDQVAGTEKAIAMGYKNIAVSTASGIGREEAQGAGESTQGREHLHIRGAHLGHVPARTPKPSTTTPTSPPAAPRRTSGKSGRRKRATTSASPCPSSASPNAARRFIEERIKAIGKKAERKPGAKQPDRLIVSSTWTACKKDACTP